jgi:hypothetical protein
MRETGMTRHIGYIHGSKLKHFSRPSFCQSGAALQEYIYYYRKGYCKSTGKPYMPEHKPLRVAA